eukprot:TRINITY_DN12062_c0_g1_i1.p2 TRINITY_DN12062_c0_g1~~TRINITY_DN12062_c0_g1_i1.p2  ORF type:complete len:90 (+),score=8.58 TRINITY_DN12062_c0_g1_i1:423-692(+)
MALLPEGVAECGFERQKCCDFDWITCDQFSNHIIGINLVGAGASEKFQMFVDAAKITIISWLTPGIANGIRLSFVQRTTLSFTKIGRLL